MKKAQRKISNKSTSGVDKYIGARMRESRFALNMSWDDLGQNLGVTFYGSEIRQRREPRERGAPIRDLRNRASFSSVDVRTRTEGVNVEPRRSGQPHIFRRRLAPVSDSLV
jgi:hypothetical protein